MDAINLIKEEFMEFDHDDEFPWNDPKIKKSIYSYRDRNVPQEYHHNGGGYSEIKAEKDFLYLINSKYKSKDYFCYIYKGDSYYKVNDWINDYLPKSKIKKYRKLRGCDKVGAPDLILCSKKNFCFIEIKSETDRIDIKQLEWIGRNNFVDTLILHQNTSYNILADKDLHSKDYWHYNNNMISDYNKEIINEIINYVNKKRLKC